MDEFELFERVYAGETVPPGNAVEPEATEGNANKVSPLRLVVNNTAPDRVQELRKRRARLAELYADLSTRGDPETVIAPVRGQLLQTSRLLAKVEKT